MSYKHQRHSVGNGNSSDEVSIEQVVNDIVRPSVQSGSASRRHNDLRQDLVARRAAHQAELERLGAEILTLEDLRRQQIQDIKSLTQQIGALDEGATSGPTRIQNYFDEFEWSEGLRTQMKKVFGIEHFRLAQEGVCNANMDGRDIICIMPTGAGKSLTYQLPATLTPGCTLVISPLVSLMRDQILHLQENQIEGLMFTASMSAAEMTEAYNRLTATATGKDSRRKEVKICYVTPERIGKSSKFKSVLATMVAAKKLARIVIDEAHCVSTQGHDYRPDYKQLSGLRLLYPHVPILALSATCPPDVLRDLISILRLAPPTDGRAAAPHGTVKFTSPLYRKNLHYKVISKPSGSVQVVRNMVSYILEHHRDETGIVYCLSRADSERVAADLDAESQGRIKTGVYHAEIKDKAKEELHDSWRSGKVKVMCATIAFGLGIDKKDVILEKALQGKSVETFYQESGRAGRDGKDADCVLYYRLQDALRTPGILQDPDWERRISGMIRFCLDFKGCRKLVFANYFSSSEWAEDNTRCGHCDNCTRDPTTVTESDVTLEAGRVLAIARLLYSRKIKVTAAQLAQAARGSGPHVKLLQLNPGDRVTLSSHDTEVLIANMLLERFLDKSYTSNAYKVQVYIKPGPLSRRLDEGQKLSIYLLLPERVARNNAREGYGPGGKRKAAGGRPNKRINNCTGATAGDGSEEEEDADMDADIVVDHSGDDGDGEDGRVGRENGPESSSAAKRRRRSSGQHHQSSSLWESSASATGPALDIDSDMGGNRQEASAAHGADYESELEDVVEWEGNLRGAPAVTHRTLRSGLGSGGSTQRNVAVVSWPPSASGRSLPQDEIIDISSE